MKYIRKPQQYKDPGSGHHKNVGDKMQFSKIQEKLSNTYKSLKNTINQTHPKASTLENRYEAGAEKESENEIVLTDAKEQKQLLYRICKKWESKNKGCYSPSKSNIVLELLYSCGVNISVYIHKHRKIK